DALRVSLARLPATLELALTALLLATGGGILLGVCSVWRRRGWLESAAGWLGTLGIAVPNFVWGLLLIVVFGAILQLLPISGRIAPEYEAAEVTGSAVVDVLLRRDAAALRSVLAHLLLPASPPP